MGHTEEKYMKKFSLIIPTYNRAHLIGRTIESCLNQTYPHFEIIVIDDGSTDNTEEIVKAFQSPKIKYYKISNSERGFARNFGVSKADGEYVSFHDSDDILYPHYFQTAFEIVSKHPDIPVFHCAYEIIQSRHKRHVVKNLVNISKRLITKGNVLSCHGVFLRKEVALSFPFNEDRTIAGLEDWELWIRISTQYEIKHFPIVTSAIIQHDERSVMQIDKDRWITKVETFIQYVTQNPDVKNKFGKYFPAFYASAYSYLALHLSFNKSFKKVSWQYFFKALKHYPPILFTRRAAAIMKRMII